MIDKDLIKNSLTLDDINDILIFFGADTEINYNKGLIQSTTICHNQPGEGRYKLFYYDNNKLFHCYTECAPSSFDIFQLIIKVFRIQKNEEINFVQAISFVVNKVNIDINNFQISFKDDSDKLMDILNSIIEDNKETEEIQLKECNGDYLIDNLICLRIPEWERDGITYETMQKYNIRFYTPSMSIVIPHYDEKGRLIGIRNRFLQEEDIKKYGKYNPLRVGNKMYNHPLGFSLYGLFQNKENIEKMKIAIIFEGEKSVLALDSIIENNISCAVCGSNISNYQMQRLVDLGVQEVCIAFDRQYKETFSEEFYRWAEKLELIAKKYQKFFTISVILDLDDLLDYKDSPVDKGREVFLKLFEKRIIS